MIKEMKHNREKIAKRLSNTGYTVMILVTAIFIGWALYRLYGYLGDFEWKKLLALCSKKGIIKIFVAYLDSFLWTAPVFCIGWALGEMGDILQRMVPGQGKDDRQKSLIGLGMHLLGGLMSVVMLLIPGLAIYFFVPLLICVIGHEIAKGDVEDDKNAKELEKKTIELEDLKQRVEQLETKLADTSGQKNKSKKQ